MKINLVFKAFLVTVIMVFLASCDKEYNDIGTNIVGGDNDHFGFEKATATAKAYNQNTGIVATNNLPINTLGIYNNPVFGKTTASFVTQLELDVVNPKFINTINPLFRIDSVYLYVPYFNNLVSTDAQTSNRTYTIDSVYNQTKKINLSVYESGYYLRDLDPSTSFQEQQRYYSNQNNDFYAVKGEKLNVSDNTAQNTDFNFSESEIKIGYTKTDGTQVVTERKTPGIFLDLKKDFFISKIINAPSGKLINNNTFKEHFRGLYFQVEENSSFPNDGAMAKINFAQGEIIIVYYDETSSSNTAIVRKTLKLNLSGNTVNLFENQFNTSFTTAINNPNIALGDEKLYIKGGEGSSSVIELFSNTDDDGNGVSDEIDNIKNNGWLINEASLTFYVNKEDMTNAEEPNRIYLYDLQNRRPVIDYIRDITTVSSNTKLNKFVHGGILEKEEGTNGRGIKYKIRITEHIRNIVKNDSTNVKLGLVVTESITNVLNNNLKTQISDRFDRIPVASIINPLGTILYGSNNNVPLDKRIKLEIYYTKPN